MHSQLEKISGTGINGRVTKNDLLNYLDRNKFESEKSIELEKKKKNDHKMLQTNSRIEEMPKMRKLISKHMKESLETSAHVYLMSEVDMTKIVNFVSKKEDQFFKIEDYNLTYTPFYCPSSCKIFDGLS